MTDCSCPLVISCELVSKLSAMLVSLYPDIVAADNDITTLGGILLSFPCLPWLGSEYIMNTCSLDYGVCGLG